MAYKYQVMADDDPLTLSKKFGIPANQILEQNGIQSLTAGQTIKVPNATTMSITRGSYNPNARPSTFTTGAAKKPGLFDILSGKYQGNGSMDTAAVGGSLSGIPLPQGPSAITNALVTGSNPLNGVGLGLSGDKQGALFFPSTAMPLPYSTLATHQPFVQGSGAAAAGPVNQYGQPVNIKQDWLGRQAGDASTNYGQYRSVAGDGRVINRDTRNIRIDPKWAVNTASVVAQKPSTVNKQTQSALDWRVAT